MLEPFLDQSPAGEDRHERAQTKKDGRSAPLVAHALRSRGLMYHGRARDVEGSAMRQKETQTKEKEVDLKGVKGGSVVKWTKPLKL